MALSSFHMAQGCKQDYGLYWLARQGRVSKCEATAGRLGGSCRIVAQQVSAVWTPAHQF